MRRKGLCKKAWTKVGAVLMSAAIVMANVTMVMPQTVVYAETTDNSSESTSEISEEGSTDGSSDASSEVSSVDEEKEETVTVKTEDAATTLAGTEVATSLTAATAGATLLGAAASGNASSGAASASSSAASEASSEGAASTSASSVEGSAASSASSVEAVTGATFIPTEEEETSGDYTVDVWDFGAEQLEGVNNKLTVDIINGFYDSSISVGSEGATVSSFETDDLKFEGSGKAHRIRTTNTDITRWDKKSKNDADGNTYTGYIYSNSGSTDSVYLSIDMEADEQVTFYAGSNGNAALYYFVNMSDASDVQTADYSGKNGVEPLTFYAKEDATYKLYCSNEKLVVARIIRTQATYHTVSGTVSGLENAEGVSLLFENQSNGRVTSAEIVDGSYSISLAEGYTYDVSLNGADAYVIESGAVVEVEDEDMTHDITTSGVDLVNYKGKITGISEDDIEEFVKAAEFTFKPSDESSVYVPQIVMNVADASIEYEVTLQDKVAYSVEVADKEDTATDSYAKVEDYNLLTKEISVDGANDNFEIAFEAKPVYNVTIVPSGATLDDLAKATFTFTRLDTENDYVADGYVYVFTGPDNIALRDGQYTVEVSNAGAFVQKLTNDLIVKGADVSKKIEFSSDITEWDFSDTAFANKFSNATEGTYNGLSWTNGRSHNGVYLYSGQGTISVPVKGACQIQVTANYQYSYYFENESEKSVNVKTGSTSQNDIFTYDYNGEKGTFDITVLGSSYITKIATVYQTEYKSEILVGASEAADYDSIGEALEAIRLMERENDERVIVSIEPGNYEEMLVVDVPNVTLKNASANPTNTLTNAGVDIDDNAVRITWYYGHGYTYYSMGDDYKYDADVLATNEANGYASVINPGSGTNTYWNATVVVSASGFEAKDIIFENSFNQYMSKKAAEDVIVPQSGAKEGSVARAGMSVGDTTVQNKSYVERAAALALTSSATEAYFDKCRIVGRQDTLYGSVGTTAAFYDCAVYGGTDYIFGGMTAVFAKCDLVLNTSEDKNDVAYITAAQQKSASTRGYLMYNCTVTSTTPGVDTASSYKSKPGQFGRPWQANTSEVVFFNTVVGSTNWSRGTDGKYVYDADSNVSLIQPEGWNTSLSGESARCVEYGTYEVSGEDNSASRVTWAQQPETAVCSDGTAISVAAFLGEWDPFEENGNDMTITFPDGTTAEEPVADENEKSDETTTTEYTFESSDLTAFVVGAKGDGETEKAGTDEYFTLVYSAKSKVDSSAKTWDDGYASSQRLSFGSKVSTEKNAIKFTTSSDEAQVEIWWVQGGDDNREMAVIDENGAVAAITSGTYTKNSPYYSKLKLEKSGTYYLGGSTNNNNIYKVVVTDSEPEEVTRADWSSVSAPVIESVALNESNANKIDVKVNALIGTDGGDSLAVTMYDEGGLAKETQKSSAEKESFDFSFTPDISGKYYFVASLSRDDDTETEAKTSAKSEQFDFTLPLTAPQFKNAVNKGNGTVTVKFYSVKEATEYTLLAIDTENESSSEIKTTYTPEEVVTNTSTEYNYTFKGLTVGHEYKLVLSAKRGEETSAESTMSIEVTEDGEQEWTFAAFGSGVNTSYNKATVHDDGSITVASTNGKGKLVPASTDGLAFYYATIPASKNFTLSATVTIDSWTLSNGQEGFGLMAADAVGVNGDSSVFWNNSYMASATKVEYYYDASTGEVTDDTSASKISMKLGLGSQQKIGVTQDNLESLKANDTEVTKKEFSSTMRTLETSCGSSGAGTYNIVGNASNDVSGTVANPITEFKLTIQKNNTGYFVSYTDAEGNTTTNKYYDTKALENIDSDYVYAGFFASRNATATFSDIELTLVNPEDDELAEERPITYVTPSYKIISAAYSNTAEYTLQYTGNADGVLTITDAKGNILVNAKTVEANAVESVETTLNKGDNTFAVKFIPDEFFHPENDEYQLLSSYEASTFTHTVNYKTISDAKEIYVSPEGTSTGEGTENSPVDIYTAVKYVQPGQTIRLAGGTYSLKSTVTVARGIDGTSSKPIRMIADSDDRAVFDFNSACAGFVFAGDYWYVSGIDCTRSGNSQKGIQISGSHITLEDIHAYENGNTGIQVSRYLSTDEWDDWPSDDLILNCTSFSNADAGYEDADGFAAKLTVADGIVFDGCISYNNADDGWDLFAKVESGCIGQVTIQNCVAFANGYGVDGTNEGNGNGFKMGGSSMSGPHKLINSVAWGNKAKGIDSNSGPDIQVYNSMSFNNGGSNVALYTNDTANTDFYVDGVLSYRTTGTSTNETLKPKGTQDTSKIYGTLNFFWNDGASANSDGLTVADDWFVSLEAPYANAADPLAVAERIRSGNGKIDLGDFLKLTDKGMETLAKAGITYSDVIATLNGSYEAASYNYDSSEENDPSSEASSESSSEAGSSASSSEAGSSASSEESGSAGTTQESSSSSSGSSKEEQTTESGSEGNTSGSTSGSDSASEGSGSTDEESSSSESDTASTSESVPAKKVEPVPVVKAIENVVKKVADKVNNFVNRIFGNDNRDDEQEVAGAEREENSDTAADGSTQEEQQTETAATADNSGDNGSQTAGQSAEEKPSNEQATPSEKTPIPVVPVAAGGATVVVVAAAAVAVKTGLMAKLLAFLHIIK
ncbi:Pectin methylesterase [Butyrivibrio sp. Su6]|uniref:pectinesterase family protein n=1 Tax=Butyrivibrio sp. Su6 TaxID=1520810 RepID=UPI00089E2EA5|nr:pectinesterase family protein [Butyrivibrio sp. Su6]SEG31763.1 Pectin methylesterase [Butyrivibrio sp. Su6]